MKVIVTALLAMALTAGVWSVALARPAGGPTGVENPPGSGTSAQPDGRDDAAASPRTVERTHILGMSASTAILAAAVVLFVVVLVASELARPKTSDRHTRIDPRL
jgi:hypothetical protein